MIPLVALDDTAAAQRAEVGGKARELGRLARRGLPVPPGFAVPVSALRGALDHAGLLALAEEVERRPDPDRIAELRARVRVLPLPEGWESELVGAARRLGGPLAVRSSAPDEDGAVRSFAGQHRTELGVAPERVPDAVRRCWASLYAPRALAYRGARGPGAGAMAVLVQELVEPRCAGALFTINPTNGSWREMVVEAVWGLGEGLMSGQIAPHWYLVRRPRPAPRPLRRVLGRVRLHVMQEDLPDLQEQWVSGANGQVLRQPTPPELRRRRTLERSALHRLCRLGLEVEAVLGEPQDVEWVRGADGAFHIVQARPITARGTPRLRQDVLWTRRFVGERWPEPATPLGWSILAPIFEWFIAYPETQNRYLGGGPPLRLVRSRPYLNTTVFRHLAFKLPGAPPPRFMLELVPPDEEEAWRRRFGVAPHAGVYASILRTTWRERRWERFRFNPLTNHVHWDRFRDALKTELPSLRRTPGSSADALRLADRQLERIRDYIGIHLCSLLFANLLYQLLEAGLAAWVPEDASALMEGLATCPPGNHTLQTNAALWTLAREASEEELDALQAGDVPTEGTFGAALAAFLEAYGHRSEASWEICAPRWLEEPSRLVPLLRSQRSVSAEDPRARAERQQLAFARAQARLRARAPAGWRGTSLELMVQLVRRYLLLRENQRFWFDHLLWSLHQTLLWIGADLVRTGVLEQAEDVAFLTFPEVRGLVEGTLPPDAVPTWVARRRAKREADMRTEPPVFLRGDAIETPPASSPRMAGLGISPGRARGAVRVLGSPADGHLLQPGDVLVTRAVDPGWTPLFLTAGAVVLEMGSVLSHGAVVAREYHVPAVVNIEGVTRRLQDGQEVTVDGTRGVVWLHP